MIEVLWHGRGGQGAFTAAKLLGAAYSKEKYALSFPSFGPERRGAPVLAFTKLDTKPIGNRSQIKKADYVLFLDDTLFSKTSLGEVKENGKILLNTKKTIQDILPSLCAEGGQGADIQDCNKIIPFDADSISISVLKMPVSNTAMLSLLAKESGLVTKEEVISAIELYMSPKIAAKNIELVEKVFGGV